MQLKNKVNFDWAGHGKDTVVWLCVPSFYDKRHKGSHSGSVIEVGGLVDWQLLSWQQTRATHTANSRHATIWRHVYDQLRANASNKHKTDRQTDSYNNIVWLGVNAPRANSIYYEQWHSARQRLSPQMSLSHLRETYLSRIRSWVVRIFHILIVYGVKICKQCLLCHWTPLGCCPPELVNAN